jgi:hypothetical protein
MHIEEPFKVCSFERASLASLLDHMRPAVETRKPLSTASAYGLKVEYLIHAPTWRTSADTPLGFHLRNPDSVTLVYATYNLLIECGYIRHGQIVCHESSKIVSDNESNVLIVTLTELAEKLHNYDKVFEHKLLEWYLAYCNAHTRVPTQIEYNSLKKKLSRSHKTFSKKGFNLANLPTLDAEAQKTILNLSTTKKL